MKRPTPEDRLAARRPQPEDTLVMFQEWHDLLFLHWEMEPALLAETLPPGLHLDTFEGRAFLGIVPFYMKNVRPRFLPAVGPISDFLEMNLRTYVHDDQGRPGVWFYSLDANQKLAVGLARRLFHLPYQHSRMAAKKEKDGWIDYETHREWTRVRSRFIYRGRGEPRASAPGTLEFFLAERYLLFTEIRGRIWSGQVSHTPYPLQIAEVKLWDDNLLLLNGFLPTGREPDFAHYSKGVKVDIYPLRRSR